MRPFEAALILGRQPAVSLSSFGFRASDFGISKERRGPRWSFSRRFLLVSRPNLLFGGGHRPDPIPAVIELETSRCFVRWAGITAVIVLVFPKRVEQVSATFARPIAQGLSIENIPRDLVQELWDERRERGGQ